MISSNFTQRKAVIVLISILVIIVIVIVAVYALEYVSQPPLSRSSYRTLDFGKDPWLSSFTSEYELAVKSDNDWIRDPTKIALRVTYGNAPDWLPPYTMSIFRTGWGRVTIVVLEENVCCGDSVASQEIRVDLIRKWNAWEVEWAGGRWRCQVGRGQQDWQPKLCY